MPSRHIVEFGFTKPLLTSNMRFRHWSQQADITRRIRYEAAVRVRALRLAPQRHVRVELHYQPRDRRRRDADNLAPTLKAMCDGVVDAGLVPDDTPNFMTKVMPIIDEPVKGEKGRVYVVIEVDSDTPTP